MCMQGIKALTLCHTTVAIGLVIGKLVHYIDRQRWDACDGSSEPVGPPGGKLGAFSCIAIHQIAICNIHCDIHCDMPAILTNLLHVDWWHTHVIMKHYQPLQHLELMDQMVLLVHLVNRALLDPLVPRYLYHLRRNDLYVLLGEDTLLQYYGTVNSYCMKALPQAVSFMHSSGGSKYCTHMEQ